MNARGGANRWLEPLFCAAIFAGLAYAMRQLIVEGYLPQPFFYFAYDVWMDWFNTAYWARDPGAYEEQGWATVYPPISFLFLLLTTDNSCYAFAEQYSARDCDRYGAIMLHGWYILNAFLVAKTFIKIDRSTALWRSVGVVVGMPMLNALERGNVVMVCFTCFLLAYGPLLKSARLRWLFAGLAVNFKVYLITGIAAMALRRKWLWAEGATIATVAIFILSWGLLGRGTPFEIVRNIELFNFYDARNLLDLWYATTYRPVDSLLHGSEFPVTAVLGSWRVEAASLAITIAVRTTQALIVVAALATFYRPEAVTNFRIVNLLGCLALITSEAGGYTQAFIIFLTFFERWQSGLGIKIAIVGCYVLALPGDIYIDPFYPLPNRGFLNKGTIFYGYWLTVGPFVRPGIVLLVSGALAWATIADVWRDVRANGWRERARFRWTRPSERHATA